MKIQRVCLLKTPLDNSYTNVIDFVNTESRKDSLIRVLTENYNFKIIDGLSRSIKRVGNSTLLVLPITYEEGREYNYLYIQDINGKIYFYFITSVTSENDNTENPSCIMTLEWDSWSNNIEMFEYCPNYIDTKHFKRFDVMEDKSLKPLYYVQQNKIDLPYTHKNIFKSLERYIPTFFVLTIKEMETLPITNFDRDFKNGGLISRFNNVGYDIEFYVSDSLNGKYNKNVVYVFAGLFDVKDEKYVECLVEGKDIIKNIGGEEITIAVNSIIKEPRLMINDKLSPFISNISLSFNSPFYYYITDKPNERKRITFTQNSVIPLVTSREDFIQFYDTGIPLAIVSSGFFIKIGDLQLNDTQRIVKYEENIEFDDLEINYNDIVGLSSFLLQEDIITSFEDSFKIDPILYTPNFTRLSLLYNNDEFTIFPINKSLSNFTIKRDFRSPQTSFKVICNEMDITQQNKFIKNSGFFSFGVDSLENFNLKNNGKAEFSIIASILNAFYNLTFATGKAASLNIPGSMQSLVNASNNIFDMIQSCLTIQSADIIPDEWVVNSGECDLLYQDRIRIKLKQVSFDNPVLKEYMNGVFMYGYNFPTIGSPFENSRVTFDYVKTKDCNLSSLKISNEDRMKLEQAFNRGITKWHFTNTDYGNIFINAMIKDSSSNTNLEIFTVTDTQIHNWLYGE